jgi:hypothetical protein
MREIPFREKKVKKKVEDNSEIRKSTSDTFPIPVGETAFREGYKEAIDMFALHAPNKRSVGRILDEHCILLENDCLRNPSRENYARYEGYRAAVKELKRVKKIK